MKETLQSIFHVFLDFSITKALPAIVQNAAAPLAQTDKIVMYGDGNSSKLIKDVMNGANQVVEGIKEATGIDLTAILGTASEKSVKADNPKE